MKYKKRILILRPDSIGDCVLFSGTLKYYRRLYKSANITLAVKKHIIPLFENCPYIDELIDYKKLSYVKDSSSLSEKFIKRIRKLALPIINQFKRKFDIIICPVRSITPEMLWIVRYLKANQKIGIVGCPSNFPKDKQYLKNKVFTDYFTLTEDKLWQHELKTNLEFIKMIGADVAKKEDIWPEFWFSIKNSNSVMKKFLINNKKYLLIVPFGTSWFRKMNYNTITKITRYFDDNCPVVIAGTSTSSGDLKIVSKLKEEHINIINILNKTDLHEFVELIQNADNIVTVETSALHIAIALHKTVYAIVGGGHWGRFFPWGDSENVHWLNKKMDCFQCNWKCKYGDYRCVRNIDYDIISKYFKKSS